MNKAVKDGTELLRWKRYPDKGKFWSINYQNSELKEIFRKKYNEEKRKGLSNKECMSRAREYTENKALSLRIKIESPGDKETTGKTKTEPKWKSTSHAKSKFWKIDNQNQILNDIFWMKYREEKNKGLAVNDCMNKARRFTEDRAKVYGMKIKYEDESK